MSSTTISQQQDALPPVLDTGISTEFFETLPIDLDDFNLHFGDAFNAPDGFPEDLWYPMSPPPTSPVTLPQQPPPPPAACPSSSPVTLPQPPPPAACPPPPPPPPPGTLPQSAPPAASPPPPPPPPPVTLPQPPPPVAYPPPPIPAEYPPSYTPAAYPPPPTRVAHPPPPTPAAYPSPSSPAACPPPPRPAASPIKPKTASTPARRVAESAASPSRIQKPTNPKNARGSGRGSGKGNRDYNSIPPLSAEEKIAMGQPMHKWVQERRRQQEAALRAEIERKGVLIADPCWDQETGTFFPVIPTPACQYHGEGYVEMGKALEALWEKASKPLLKGSIKMEWRPPGEEFDGWTFEMRF
ncbi:MAG: hypothetical protein Q9188_005255 [Gyalolechia gomerana]